MDQKLPKILFFMPDTGGSTMDGPTNDAINIAKSFADSNVPAIFIFNGHQNIFDKFQQTGIDVRRIEMPVSGVKQHFNPFYRRRFSRQLTKLIHDEGIDIFHLGHGGPYVFNYVKNLNVLKVTVQSGSTPGFEPLKLFPFGIKLHPRDFLKAWYRKYVRLDYTTADLVFSPGDAAHEATIRVYKVNPERAMIMRIASPEQVPTSKHGAIRREFGITENEKVIVTVGRITKAKGVEDIGEVAKILASRGKNYRFLFAGYERDEAYGKKIREKYGEFVTFIGHRHDIANALSDADLMAHLSHREGTPLAIIESLEFGIPCVAWDLPGVSEDVEDGVTGRAVQFGDHTAAADAIEEILDHSTTYETFSEGARQRFKRFSIDDYAGRLLAAYENRQRAMSGS
jgi:glycosyltransferase involved in cell wall biosynthesis